MIARPTTEQVLLDCCRVLTDDVLPALGDPVAQVRVVMLEKVLRNAAVRAAGEIAWMREEIATIEDYARKVLDRTSGDPVRQALAVLTAGPRDSLLLDDVVESYCRAGDALSAALEAVLAAGCRDLQHDGEQLLEQRLHREDAVVGGWQSAGR
ncbi:MAG: hypothetical protein JWN08_2327 [Frankiales bacterium]|nr:hypothetical protein [Frankiales bacterium]